MHCGDEAKSRPEDKNSSSQGWIWDKGPSSGRAPHAQTSPLTLLQDYDWGHNGDRLQFSGGRDLLGEQPSLEEVGSPRHWGAKGWIPSHTSLFCMQSVGIGHGCHPLSEYLHHLHPGMLWLLRENRAMFAASPALLSNLPFALPGEQWEYSCST